MMVSTDKEFRRAAIVNVKAAVTDCAGELESFTVTPMEYVPLSVEVPDKIPVDAPRERPAGSRPDVILHV